VYLEGVKGLEAGDEVVEVGGGGVLDAEIVINKGERDGEGVMSE
jgi:hypothetical protein